MNDEQQRALRAKEKRQRERSRMTSGRMYDYIAHDGNRVANYIECRVRELRTLLDARGVADREVRACLGSIEGQTQHFGELFQRWSPSFQPNKRSRCDLVQIVHAVYPYGNNAIGEWKVPNNGIQAFVGMDHRDAYALVLNVLANATRWASGKGFDVPRAARRVHVSVEPVEPVDDGGPRGVLLVVEDGGPGLPDGWTLDAVADGHGVGLQIVAEIAEEWGASMSWDRSPELGGARFTFRFASDAR